MASDTWYANLEDRLFTIVKTRFKKKHSTEYPTMDFITDDEQNKPSKFPTIYFRELDQSEKGNDLENIGVNLVNEVIEVEVITTNSKLECKKVAVAVDIEMKTLAFKIIEKSPVMIKGDIFRRVTRYERIIGADDLLN